jgi:hypothetical protein
VIDRCCCAVVFRTAGCRRGEGTARGYGRSSPVSTEDAAAEEFDPAARGRGRIRFIRVPRDAWARYLSLEWGGAALGRGARRRRQFNEGQGREHSMQASRLQS